MAIPVQSQPASRILPWQRVLQELAGRRQVVPDAVLRETAAACSLSPTTLVESLRTAFQGLASQLASESHTELRSTPEILVLSASNIPVVALGPAIYLSALGARVCVKLTPADSALLPWLLQHAIDASGGSCAIFDARDWSRDSLALDRALRGANLVLAFGREDSIAAVRGRTTARVVGFAEKFSVSVVVPNEDEAEGFDKHARDAVLFGQRGCLSSQAIFVKGGEDAARKWGELFWQRYAALVETLDCTASTARAEWHNWFERCELSGWELAGSSSRFGAVSYPDRFEPDGLVGNGMLQVVPFRDEADLRSMLGPYERFLQGATVAGPAPERTQFEQVLRSLGFSFITQPGNLQGPPLDWANGHVDLATLAAESSTAIGRRVIHGDG